MDILYGQDNLVGQRMQNTITYAMQSSHKFSLQPGSKFNSAPKLSAAGQFYLACEHCKRCVFEDGTGSATETHVCGY